MGDDEKNEWRWKKIDDECCIGMNDADEWKLDMDIMVDPDDE